MNIERKSETFVKYLSGGEQKRLSIAIELIHDPKIIFLDEPTTGLDNVASTNCLQHLKDLTKEGRAIIITIHQPSALILKMFDHVYALANGQCIYQGASEEIVPFLEGSGLVCPSTYNPADFLLEIANDDYGEFNNILAERIKNKWNDNNNQRSKEITENVVKVASGKVGKYMTSYASQVYYLMLRTFLITSRDKTLLYARVLIHLFLGLVIGILFQNVGNKGEMMISNYLFLVVTVMILIFTSYHSHFVTCKFNFLNINLL